MQTFFTCCHGYFESQAGRWICTAASAEVGAVDEEIIGDESPAYQPHIHGEDAKVYGANKLQYGRPPAPISHLEDDKESAKIRLQRLIRDFAHDAVGPGLEVEARSQVLQSIAGIPGGAVQTLLRMDRRLSRLELWPPSSTSSDSAVGSPTLTLPLPLVENILKGSSDEGGEPDQQDMTEGSGSSKENATLTIVQRSGPLLKLVFDSRDSRDKAYTCLRIFMMSVDQSGEGQSPEDGDGDDDA